MKFPGSEGRDSRRFADRADAGRQLGERLEAFRGQAAVVCGLPRGGVAVAYEVAVALSLPLDVLVVGKVGAPFQPELAIGAVGERGVQVENADVMHLAGVSQAEFERRTAPALAEVARRAELFRGGRRPSSLAAQIAIVVDDGVATGASSKAAAAVARSGGAMSVVLAAPVGAPESLVSLANSFDEIVCLKTPARFMSVGEWYEDFDQTTDAEVRELLERAASRHLPEGGGTG